MCRYFQAQTVLAHEETDWGLELLRDPIRLELLDHVTLTYADEPSANYDITLKTDIEHHNFGGVSPDTLLGWASGPERSLFTALDVGGRCAVTRLVLIKDGELYPAQPLKLFMITNNAAIAYSDCLFYAVADDGSTICA
jgi:hypothetical protein